MTAVGVNAVAYGRKRVALKRTVAELRTRICTKFTTGTVLFLEHAATVVTAVGVTAVVYGRERERERESETDRQTVRERESERERESDCRGIRYYARPFKSQSKVKVLSTFGDTYPQNCINGSKTAHGITLEGPFVVALLPHSRRRTVLKLTFGVSGTTLSTLGPCQPSA